MRSHGSYNVNKRRYKKGGEGGVLGGTSGIRSAELYEKFYGNLPGGQKWATVACLLKVTHIIQYTT